jgi:hypothetical protein
VRWPTKRVSEDAAIAGASGAGLVLGYSRMNKKKIREGIRLLSEVFWLPDYASHKR